MRLLKSLHIAAITMLVMPLTIISMGNNSDEKEQKEPSPFDQYLEESRRDRERMEEDFRRHQQEIQSIRKELAQVAQDVIAAKKSSEEIKKQAEKINHTLLENDKNLKELAAATAQSIKAVQPTDPNRIFSPAYCSAMNLNN